MMKELIWAEHQKLRRSKIVLVAIFAVIMVAIIVFTQGQFSFGEKRYIDDAGWFMNAAQSLATFFVLPAVIALLGSYMICREEQEDTIKSLVENYICLFNYLFISSQMSAKPYFIGSTGILLLW